jgi:hypothetical protein
MNFASIILVALLAIVAPPQQPKPDVKGSSDYPLFVNRMPGYRISSYEKQGFSSYSFHTKPPQTIEGRFLRIVYYLDQPNEHPGGLLFIATFRTPSKRLEARSSPPAIQTSVSLK